MIAGLNTIEVNSQEIDIGIIDRGSNTTIVVFNGALSARATTLPSLQGVSLTESTDTNLVAVSDPTLSMGDLDLAWYLGNRLTGPLPLLLGPLIDHAIASLPAGRTLAFGASGGGYAAILYSRHMAVDTVLAVNPRLDLGARPKPAFDEYLSIAHGASDKRSKKRALETFVPVRLKDEYSDGLPTETCIFQNTGDQTFQRHQLRPFAEMHLDDPKLSLRMEFTAEGHSVIPGSLLREIISGLKTSVDGGGFLQARDCPEFMDLLSQAPQF